MQFLQSAWLLSQSGTVANRLGQVLEKQGQPEKARHMYALAAAAGGSVVGDSRSRLAKLASDPGVAEKELINVAAIAAFTLNDAPTPRVFRLTQVLVREGDGWKIISHHVSPK